MTWEHAVRREGKVTRGVQVWMENVEATDPREIRASAGLVDQWELRVLKAARVLMDPRVKPAHKDRLVIRVVWELQDSPVIPVLLD